MGVNNILESLFICFLIAGILRQIIQSVFHKAIRVSWLSVIFFSLATNAFYYEGIQSSTFGISLVIASVIAFDDMGIRYHLGKHSEVLNILQNQISHQPSTPLKEYLGHLPFEVLVGILVGISSTIIYQIFCS